jgi:hypothetical protein
MAIPQIKLIRNDKNLVCSIVSLKKFLRTEDWTEQSEYKNSDLPFLLKATFLYIPNSAFHGLRSSPYD